MKKLTMRQLLAVASMLFGMFFGAGNLIFPASMEEDPYYQTYFDALKALGYCGGISMEGFPESRESFPQEAADTCRFLRSASR